MDTDTPDTGANKGSDFQPPTGNPQNAPIQLFQQQNGLQNPQSLDILQEGKTIQVPVSPAPPPTAVTVARDSNWLLIGLAVLALIASLIVWWLSNRYPKSKQKTEAMPVPAADTPPPPKIIAPSTPARSKKAIDRSKRTKKRKRSKK